MIFIPVDDQNYYADADAYYGSGRVFGVGSGVDDEKYKTIMEFLDWYASPEGLDFQHAGIKDFNYTVGDDGKYTAINDNALMDNLPVPVALASDTADISVIRNQCNETLCDYSWKMIFAESDADFDAMWKEMTDTLDGNGFQDLYKFDCEKWQPQIDAKNAL